MPFIRIHRKVARAAFGHVNRLHNLNLDPGGYLDNIAPDRQKPGHGYDVIANSGNIVDLILLNFHALEIWLARIDSREAQGKAQICFRYICHYLADAFSLGQISREFWGKYDDAMDFMGEFVSIPDPVEEIINKYEFPGIVGAQGAEAFIRDMIYNTYSLFGEKAKKNKLKFIVSEDYREMVRREVWLSVPVAVALFDLAMLGARERKACRECRSNPIRCC